VAPDRSDEDQFAEFVATAEPRLRRALFPVGGVATADAVADALAYAWEHWDRVQAMDNPIGYLYRVGRSRLRPRKTPVLPPVDTARIPDVEPGLAPALARLPERQRVAVVLVHGFGWTHQEVADLWEVSVSTVRNHLARGIDRLRATLEVNVRD
jgi:RNA polymerase sigma-70 factor (ECF subfamily)